MHLFAVGDSSPASWTTVALSVVGLLTLIFKWWRDERIANNNVKNREELMRLQTENLSLKMKVTTDKVVSAIAPVAEKVEKIDIQTNGQFQETVKKAVADGIASGQSGLNIAVATARAEGVKEGAAQPKP